MTFELTKWRRITIETDKRVAPPIPFVNLLGLQNLRRRMQCCRAIKTKHIGGTVVAYQCPYPYRLADLAISRQK